MVSEVLGHKAQAARTALGVQWRNYLSKKLLVDGEPEVQLCGVVLQNPSQGIKILVVLQLNMTQKHHG